MEALRKSQLSPERKRLVDLMQRIRFGQIRSIEVHDGEPVIDSKVSIRRTHVFGKPANPAPSSADTDFLLKEKVIELFSEFDDFGTVTVCELVIADGLPMKMAVDGTVEDLIAS